MHRQSQPVRPVEARNVRFWHGCPWIALGDRGAPRDSLAATYPTADDNMRDLAASLPDARPLDAGHRLPGVDDHPTTGVLTYLVEDVDNGCHQLNPLATRDL